MNRAEMEAVIWQAMRVWRVTCPAPVRFADTILAAADRYARPEGHDQASRRAALALATSTVVHYGSSRRACRKAPAGGRVTLSLDPVTVTCRRCKQTRPYAAALREAS
jgi:hypothetical protein